MPEETEEEEEQADEDQGEDEAFAKDYLNRVRLTCFSLYTVTDGLYIQSLMVCIYSH